MNPFTYLVQAFAWSVAGGLIGFMFGTNLCRTTEGADVKQTRWWPKFDYVITALFLTLAVLTAVQGYVLGNRTDELSRCQLAYSTGFADAIDARSQATAQAQEALDQWMTTVNASIQTPSPEAAVLIRQAFTDYLNARAEAKKTQQDNPYPPAPREACPEVDR